MKIKIFWIKCYRAVTFFDDVDAEKGEKGDHNANNWIVPDPQPNGLSDLPLFDMMPFGSENGDVTLPPSDDAFAPVTLFRDPFIFANSTYGQLFVNTNGRIPFEKGSQFF
ncbi:Sushi, nidogen and EGF-like domain-containing protein 1 [Folsomia candida]|uniref:Sushi, nidogen and EGF-like domain-containing protein 1 n=1 Tax=Folsomia candida TaxID=158441 RepID=A0A226D2C4_FOLCA|nr:Sushi, nidogen and EGF-like domain-containing protein 1 [Folsomia candida]